MENPREVARLLSAILVVFIVALLVLSIVLGDWNIVLWGLAVVAGMAILCIIASMANLVVFGPLMWLMSRISPRKPPDRETSHDQASALNRYR